MKFLELTFFGLKRKLPLSYLSPTKMIANFNILGDVEFTDTAGIEMEKLLRKENLIPECFVGPGIKIVPFVHHLAKRLHHQRYVILRKSIKGYMVNPLVKNPEHYMPAHVKKMVLDEKDREFLKDKNVVLVDDVVSTGYTMNLLEDLMEEIGARVIGRCSLFRQGDVYNKPLIYLSQLPMINLTS